MEQMAPTPPAPPPPPVVPQKKRHTLRWMLIAFGAIVVIAAAAGGGDDDTTSGGGSATPAVRSDDSSGVPESDLSTNTENPPGADVQIETCVAGNFGPEVKLRITNHSSKRSDYLISLGAEDAAGNKVGDGFASTDNVDPGQTALIDGILTGDNVDRCVVEEVERFAS